MLSGVNFQQFCSLPSLACREIKDKVSISKQWMSLQWEKTLKTLDNKENHPHFHNFYKQSIKPLRAKHVFLLVGVPVIALAVSFVALQILNPAAFVLTVFIESIAVACAIIFPLRYLDSYHKQKTIPHIEAIKEAVEASNFDQAGPPLAKLEKPKFAHFEKETNHLKAKLKLVQQSQTIFQRNKNKQLFIAYINEILKSLHSLEKEIKNEKLEAELERQADLIKNELIDHAQKLEQALEMELNVGVKQIFDELKILEDSRFSNFKERIDKLQKQFSELIKEQEKLTQDEGKQRFLENINEFKDYLKNLSNHKID